MEPEFFMKAELFWFLLGLVLLLLELVIPGFVVIFFGIGAWITAFVCLVADPGLNLQIIIFTLSSLMTLIFLRRLMRNKFFKGEILTPQDMDEEFIGKQAVALSDISKGERGKLEFKGSQWDGIAADDIKKGQTVIITGKESIVLNVKPKQ